ncbi:hypothetical protein BV20DRAFT_970806 [Pilatotrama ljubarskyi]|nr:hypothetical protein BV20DRAFT_970806 [Pilatotrama ljubarskyi]
MAPSLSPASVHHPSARRGVLRQDDHFPYPFSRSPDALSRFIYAKRPGALALAHALIIYPPVTLSLLLYTLLFLPLQTLFYPMALALPTPSSVAQTMPPTRSASIKSPPHCRTVMSIDVPSPAQRRDPPSPAHSRNGLSPAESDDAPLSPMIFQPNEEYEKQRLSYYPPPPRAAASTPSSPNDTEAPSPVIFSHPNLSSPSVVLPSLPAFPETSLEARFRRPLPPLPKVVTHPDGGATETASRHDPTAFRAKGGRASPYGSDVDERDSDSATAFSPSPSTSSHSPSTSTYTTASSEPPESCKAVDMFSNSEAKPRHLTLTIPARSQSAPLPPREMPVSFADRSVSPHIAVTPASPQQAPQFAQQMGGWKKLRTASETSIVLASDTEDDPEPARKAQPPPRSASPAPSLAPSVSSAKSASKPKSTLKRIASRTKLFGRRTMSSASDPWAEDDDSTIVGHGSISLDGQNMRPGARARSESPLGSGDSGSGRSSYSQRAGLGCADSVPRAMRRVEISEVTLTPHGDVWEARELDEVIPKLRQLRAPTRIRL